MQDNKVPCTRDHPKYPDLQVAITELLLKDKTTCTPGTLRKTHKQLCDLFQEKSFANQFSSTKKLLKKKLDEQGIKLGDNQHKQSQRATAGSPIYEGGKYKPKYILRYLYLMSHKLYYYQKANQSTVTVKTTKISKTKKISKMKKKLSRTTTTTKKKTISTIFSLESLILKTCQPARQV